MKLFHFTSQKHALAALRSQRLKVALIPEMNDPFELLCVDLREPKARKAFYEFRDEVSKQVGFLCFSRHWRNPLLWSHYGDKHQGVALVVEVDPDMAMPVTYLKKRPQWDARAIMKSGGFTGKHVDVLTRSKSHHWEYEEEVRVGVSLAGDTPDAKGRYFSPVSIVGVVAGAHSLLVAEDIAKALPRTSAVSFTQARLAFRSFNVTRRRDRPVVTVRGRR